MDESQTQNEYQRISIIFNGSDVCPSQSTHHTVSCVCLVRSIPPSYIVTPADSGEPSCYI